jgi:hypothetical protein
MKNSPGLQAEIALEPQPEVPRLIIGTKFSILKWAYD